MHTHVRPEDVSPKIGFSLKKTPSDPDWCLSKDTLIVELIYTGINSEQEWVTASENRDV
jgi:hypothetical protein